MYESTLEEKAVSKMSIRKMAYLATKRIFDILVSLIGLVLIVPIAMIIKLAYMFTGDFTSIFYSQTRIGKNGKLFKLYKFRSMVHNADEILFKKLELNPILEEEYRVNKKLKKDPRITKVGRIIRKLSIDELPQLINIFLGQMSLIGNRPYLPREKEDMGEHYNNILKTKPGLTGYWQVSGRSNTTFDKRLKLEEEYSEKASLGLDILIFFKTFKVVLFGKGAE